MESLHVHARFNNSLNACKRPNTASLGKSSALNPRLFLSQFRTNGFSISTQGWVWIRAFGSDLIWCLQKGSSTEQNDECTSGCLGALPTWIPCWKFGAEQFQKPFCSLLVMDLLAVPIIHVLIPLERSCTVASVTTNPPTKTMKDWWGATGISSVIPFSDPFPTWCLDALKCIPTRPRFLKAEIKWKGLWSNHHAWHMLFWFQATLLTRNPIHHLSTLCWCSRSLSSALQNKTSQPSCKTPPTQVRTQPTHVRECFTPLLKQLKQAEVETLVGWFIFFLGLGTPECWNSTIVIHRRLAMHSFNK